MIDVVVAKLLHNNEPLKLPAVNTELPQLFTKDTVGAVGTGMGADVPLPPALVQFPIVCVTVYVAASVTVIDDVVAPLLHNNEPVKLEAVNKELPQLFTVVIVGGTGIVLTAAIPLPATLVHPLTV